MPVDFPVILYYVLFILFALVLPVLQPIYVPLILRFFVQGLVVPNVSFLTRKNRHTISNRIAG